MRLLHGACCATVMASPRTIATQSGSSYAVERTGNLDDGKFATAFPKPVTQPKIIVL